jgi:phosphoribosylglycinamide formyltransferase 1
MSKLLKLGIIGSTRGTDMTGIIEAINSGRLSNAKIEVVVSNKKNALILEKARSAEIPAIFLTKKTPTGLKSKEQYDIELAGIMKEYGVELVVLIGYMKILTPVFINTYENKIINVHPSLLPKFAGGMDGDVHQAVLDAGEIETGCTVHLVTEVVDGGRILKQKSCKVENFDTADILKIKVQKLEVEALVEVIEEWNQILAS